MLLNDVLAQRILRHFVEVNCFDAHGNNIAIVAKVRHEGGRYFNEMSIDVVSKVLKLCLYGFKMER